MRSFDQHKASSSSAAWLLKVGACVVLATALSQCTSSKLPDGDLVVSVKEQKLGVYDKSGKLSKKYVISTSKFGLGDKKGSNCTPLGKHEIVAKIGHGLPAGAVLKSRHWNGEVLKPNAPGRDPIVSRILWLKGTETSNKNAYNRFIYIHGTPEEKNLGRPASFGCVRMGMKDVVDLFNAVDVGVKVTITTDPLPRGNLEKPKTGEGPDDGSPALNAPGTLNAEPLHVAKITASEAEKKRAEENEAKARAKIGSPKGKSREQAAVKTAQPQEAEAAPTRAAAKSKASSSTKTDHRVAGKTAPKSKGKA